jgi:DNA-binding MarR family transcriptional regulator
VGSVVSKDVQAIAEGFSRLMRLVQRARNRGKHFSGIDHTGFIITKLIVTGEASRASEIGQTAEIDPSIVTRQVHQLIDAGFIERFADPVDGRASLLRCTEAGRDFYNTQCSTKENFYADVFREWNESDIATFARLLTQLNIDIESALHSKNQQSSQQEK